MEREEIEAMWERIVALEGKSLWLAQAVGSAIVALAYNSMLITIAVGKPEGLSGFIEYMQSKMESARQAAVSATSIEDALKVAVDFQNDCVAYLHSRK